MIRNWMQIWMEYMGLKKTKEVAEILHTTKYWVSKRRNGLAEVSERERLAMSAVAAGLKPWTPEYHSRLLMINDMQGFLKDVYRDSQRSRS